MQILQLPQPRVSSNVFKNVAVETWIILGVGIAATIVLSFIIRKVVSARMKNKRNFDRSQILVYTRVLHYITMLFGILITFRVADIPITAVLASSAALLVGVGFGIQNVVNNFICGLILLFEKPIKIGDYIRVMQTEGKVVRILNRCTHLLTLDNEIVVIPNSKMLDGVLINMSSLKNVRIESSFHVAYGTDLMLVRETLMNIASLHPQVQKDPAPHVFCNDFDENGIAISLYVHITEPEKHPKVISDLNYAIDKAFREKGLVIPYPQRVVHMRQF